MKRTTINHILSKLCHLEMNREICFKPKTDSSASFGMTNKTQSGFAPILILILVVLGVLAGTYLVQNGVSFLPHASGKTVACDGQSLGGQSEQSQADFAAVYGPNAVEEWVAEHENELVKKGIPCKDPGGYAPGIGTGQNAYKGGSSGSSSSSSNSPVCKQPAGETGTVATTYYDAKVANNLARFYAIKEGVAGLCVPADLGVGSQITEKAQGGEGRLLLCSTDKGDLVWKVIVNNKLVDPLQKDAPSRDTIEAGFADKIKEAKDKIGAN